MLFWMTGSLTSLWVKKVVANFEYRFFTRPLSYAPGIFDFGFVKLIYDPWNCDHGFLILELNISVAIFSHRQTWRGWKILWSKCCKYNNQDMCAALNSKAYNNNLNRNDYSSHVQCLLSYLVLFSKITFLFRFTQKHNFS